VAVPAVRLLLKRHGIDIRDVPGTGKGGRVTKEDVQRYIERQESSVPAAPVAEQSGATVSDTDATVAMTATEARMFQVMTESLSIPQLGYTHAVDLTTVDRIRRQCNLQTGLASELAGRPPPNLTFLPIIIKAISMAFEHHKRMNSHLKFPSSGSQDPQLTLKQSHDFGIAVDTPHGLFVPVVRGVQRRSIYSIAEEIDRLSILCRQGKIQPADLRGATFMVSNIGSIGGSVIRPILVPPMVAIVALGRVEAIARFGTSAQGTEELVKRQEAMLSWSADHRVLDGASVARCARLVCTILEGFDGVPLAVM
jgi:2-oxoisovalerate dehydrogenase E2 component (dihydrolipoyl transacylase)